MDVRLPDGTIVRNVPEGTTKAQLTERMTRAQNRSKAEGQTAEWQAKIKGDLTGDMSFTDKFNSGMGKAFTDLGRGAAQLVGLGPDAEETRETRRLDSQLMNTGSGMAGNISGNIAALAPLALVPGANTVAGAGALGSIVAGLQPTESTGERLFNMGEGGALGAGVQTVARYPMETMEVAKKYLGAPFRAAKAAVEPFYEGGREQILGRAVRDVVGPNSNVIQQRLASAKSLVPGSQPTAGEVGQSGGLASLQRGAAASNPEAYTTRAAQQNEARVKALTDLSGTGGQREFYDASRKTAANQLYEQAYQRGVDIRRDPTTGQFLPKAQIAGNKGEITKLMQRPAIQDAVQKARTLAANEGVNMKDMAGSVKGLDYVKRALDDQIGQSSGNEQRILVDLKNRLLTTLDKLSPDYAQARVTFRDMSKPINQMDIAQTISDKSVNKLTGQLQPQAYARALSDDTAAAATGFGKATLADTFEPQQLSSLNAIKEDLARSVSARDLGRGPGSDTVQKLAMSNIMERAGIPSNVANFPGINKLGNVLYGSSDEQMRQMLANALLEPKETARLMGRVPPYKPLMQTNPELGNKSALLGRALTLPMIPTAVQQR